MRLWYSSLRGVTEGKRVLERPCSTARAYPTRFAKFSSSTAGGGSSSSSTIARQLEVEVISVAPMLSREELLGSEYVASLLKFPLLLSQQQQPAAARKLLHDAFSNTAATASSAAASRASGISVIESILHKHFDIMLAEELPSLPLLAALAQSAEHRNSGLTAAFKRRLCDILQPQLTPPTADSVTATSTTTTTTTSTTTTASSSAAANVRRWWLAWEWLTQTKLPLPDYPFSSSSTTNASALLPRWLPEAEFHTTQGTPSLRHGVVNNVLGNPWFCPCVRKQPPPPPTPTATSEAAQEATQEPFDARQLCVEFVRLLQPLPLPYHSVLLRGIANSDARASLQLDDLGVGSTDVESFARAVEVEMQRGKLDEDVLRRLHAAALAGSYASVIHGSAHGGSPYRSGQVYIPTNEIDQEEFGYQKLLTPTHVAYLPPPADVLLALLPHFVDAIGALLEDPGVDPTVAAAVGYAGVSTLHPFAVGNGAVARALFSWILYRKFVNTATAAAATSPSPPMTICFPVSTYLASCKETYNAVLKYHAKQVMSAVQFEVNVRTELPRHHSFRPYLYVYNDLTILHRFFCESLRQSLPLVQDKPALMQEHDWRIARVMKHVPGISCHRAAALARLYSPPPTSKSWSAVVDWLQFTLRGVAFREVDKATHQRLKEEFTTSSSLTPK